MNHASKSLTALIALGAALAMPMAFAQITPATSGDAMQPTPEPRSQADQMQSAQTQPKQVTWADLDADKDGNLSKQETATLPALNQVFDQADANADGKLTAEEYKSFAAKNAAKAGNAGGG